MMHLAASDQSFHGGTHDLAGNCKTHARETIRVRYEEGVDADHFTASITSGPPEFPGLMAASVWMKLPGARPLRENGFGRFRPLTIPRVTVKRKPKGLPKASTVCPGRNEVELPQGAFGILVPSTLITARSVSGSAPISLAVIMRRSLSVTRISTAPSMT